MSEKTNIIELGTIELSFEDFTCDADWILDFGGGGEGIIGHVCGSNVIAIDRLESELLEANENGSAALPVIMDGKELQFPANTFHMATAFFSFLYVPAKDQGKIMSELIRVLQPAGTLSIWDLNFILPEAESKPAVVRLEITTKPEKVIKTGYGTHKRRQSSSDIIILAKQAGFTVSNIEEHDIYFYLELEKPK